MILNQYFDKIYCINLKRRSDRWMQVSQEFERLGINVERFEAIDTGSWHGARLSHMAITRQAKYQEYKRILVFEDDIEFVVTDKEYYSNVINSIPDWQLLYFSANTSRRLKKYNEYLYHARNCLALHTVAYNESVYDLVLKCPEMQIDLYLKNEIQPIGKSFIASQLCTIQKADYSDIENVQVNYDFMPEYFRKNTSMA